MNLAPERWHLFDKFKTTTIGVLGMGSAGSRHTRLLHDLGCNVVSFDPKDKDTDARKDVIAEAAAVIIATPSHFHPSDLADVITAGKHCLVEKPIGLVGTSKGITDTLRLADEKGLTVATGFNLRFNRAADHLRHEIKERGRPFFASFVCGQSTENREAMINGCLNDWACHEIDLAQYLLGPLILMSSHITPLSVDLELRDMNNCRVCIHSDMRTDEPIRYAVTIGDSFSTMNDLQHRSPVTDQDYKEQLMAFLETIGGMPSTKLATGREGLSVLKLSEIADAR